MVKSSKKKIIEHINKKNNIELYALAFYDDQYIKTRIRTYRDKFYKNFRGLNVPEDGI